MGYVNIMGIDNVCWIGGSWGLMEEFGGRNGFVGVYCKRKLVIMVEGEL